MSPVPRDEAALRLTVAFVNTYDLLEPEPDRLSVELARRLVAEHGHAELARHLSEVDLADLRDLRGTLYRIFAAGDPAARLAELRRAVDARRALATLVDGPAGPRLALAAASGDPLDRLAALLLDALADAVVTGGPQRLGTCAGHPCRCAYVDRTRAGRQRFCCDLCNDRAAAAAYRARRAT